MKQVENNYAFIDGQNLYLAISSLGWKLDYKRFRTYLLVNHLIIKNKLKKLLIPNQHSYSQLLKQFSSEYLAFVSDLQVKLSYKRKEPRAD